MTTPNQTPNTLEQFIEHHRHLLFLLCDKDGRVDLEAATVRFEESLRECAEKTVESVVHADNEDALEAARAWLGTDTAPEKLE